MHKNKIWNKLKVIKYDCPIKKYRETVLDYVNKNNINLNQDNIKKIIYALDQEGINSISFNMSLEFFTYFIENVNNSRDKYRKMILKDNLS